MISMIPIELVWTAGAFAMLMIGLIAAAAE